MPGYGGNGVEVPPARLAHRGAYAERLGHRVQDACFLDFPAGARRLASGGDRAEHRAGLAGHAFHPRPVLGLGEDQPVAADVDHGPWVRWEIEDGEAGHVGLRERPAHGVGVDHREIEDCAREERLEAIVAADLPQHDCLEGTADIGLHHADGLGHDMAIGHLFLDHHRGTHLADAGDEIIIGEIERIHEADAPAGGIELPRLEQAVVGVAPAAGAEDPGAGRQIIQIGLADWP